MEENTRILGINSHNGAEFLIIIWKIENVRNVPWHMYIRLWLPKNIDINKQTKISTNTRTTV